MQTKFSLAQLSDANISEMDAILRSCVHCGFCLATCPTYLLTGNELDSPRGRIVLMKEMLESGVVASATAQHVDRCLSCLSCMTTCPSGVDYQHLIDHARAEIEKGGNRPFKRRWVRGILAAILPYPGRFYGFGRLAGFVKPFRPLLPRRLRALLEFLPDRLYSPVRLKAIFPSMQRPAKGRVALMLGCIQDTLRPNINAAAVRLLTHAGYEVVTLTKVQCCGALLHHLGKASTAERMAASYIAALVALYDRLPFDYVAITASGCGATVKNYDYMFRYTSGMADKAKWLSAKYRDVSELLADFPTAGPRPSTPSVVYQAPCSLYHGQKVPDLPAEILRKAGFSVCFPSEPHICCGSAGVYNLLQPDLATDLKDRKLRNLKATGAEVIATANIGCLSQLSQKTGTPIYHWVELVDWAVCRQMSPPS